MQKLGFKLIIQNKFGIIPNLICTIKLLVNEKNNFSLGLFKTDANGTVSVTQSFAEDKIKEFTSLFPNDYNGDSDNFQGKLECAIESGADMNVKLEKVKEILPENYKKMLPIIEGNSNGKIKSSSAAVLDISEHMALDITPICA